MNRMLMRAVCFAVVCITLSLGLWPFHAPRNQVAWMQRANGLEFGKYGTVLSSGPLDDGHSWKDPSGSIEMWVQPDRWVSSATLLALYRPEQGLLVTLRQSLTDLELVSQTSDDWNGRGGAHFFVNDAFSPALQRKKPVFITVHGRTPGNHGVLGRHLSPGGAALLDSGASFQRPSDRGGFRQTARQLSRSNQGFGDL